MGNLFLLSLNIIWNEASYREGGARVWALELETWPSQGSSLGLFSHSFGGYGNRLGPWSLGWGLSPDSALLPLRSWTAHLLFPNFSFSSVQQLPCGLGEPSLTVMMWLVGSFQLLSVNELFQLCTQYWEMLLRDDLQGKACGCVEYCKPLSLLKGKLAFSKG